MYKSINDIERRIAVSFKSKSCNEATQVVLGEGWAVAAGGRGRLFCPCIKNGGNWKEKVVVSRMDTPKHGWTAYDVYSTEN